MMRVIFSGFVFVSLMLMLACIEKKEAIIPKKEIVETFDPYLNTDYIMGKFEPSAHELFVEIPPEYSDRKGRYLRKEALSDFIKMHESAKSDGIRLVILSAARNFDYQKGIWENKWNGTRILSDGSSAVDISSPVERARKILLYSAMPGTSRHHWGTDFDLNNFNNEWFESGQGLRVYQWLQANASTYGFCQVYTSKDSDRPSGYEEEKWHWSYTPLSSSMTRYAELNLKNDDVVGFSGAEVASEIDIINNYVLGIHPKCRN